MRITGERIVTPEGGFNASWQRHAACYGLTASFLNDGPVLDLGCGSGHARAYLDPRRSVGVDLDHACLVHQDRETLVADFRRLPFTDACFDSVLCVHAIEHVPDPEPVLAEATRVMRPNGVAVFVTPNRLTFGRPDEIIDPYHFVEYDAGQLAELCHGHFSEVRGFGIFGSDRYLQFHAAERRRLDALLRLDPLRIRRLVPRRVRQLLYDSILIRARRNPAGPAVDFGPEDFYLSSEGLDEALDVATVCR